MDGWPEVCPSEDLRAYWLCKHELTVENDCLFLRTRVVIPSQLLAGLLYTLYEVHPIVVRMKGLACYQLRWPNVDKDIENFYLSAVRASRKHTIRLEGIFYH